MSIFYSKKIYAIFVLHNKHELALIQTRTSYPNQLKAMNKVISSTDALLTQKSNLVFHQVLQAENCNLQIDSESKITIVIPSGKIESGSCELIPVQSNSSSNERSFVLIPTNDVNVQQKTSNEVIKQQAGEESSKTEIDFQFQNCAKSVMEIHTQPKVAQEQLESINAKLLPETPVQPKNLQPNADINAGFRWAIRCRVLELLKENKQLPRSERKHYAEIAEIAGCKIRLVKNIAKMLRINPNLEPNDLLEKKRGRAISPFGKITYFAYLCLMSAIHFALPSDYGLTQSTWTAEAICLFLEICDISVTRRYVYDFCNKVGLNSKVGRRINPKKDQESVNIFTGDTYVDLCKEAKANGETILFCDETSLQQGEKIYGYSLVGERANTAYTQSNRHTAMSLLTFIGPDGTIEVFEIEGSFDAEKFCDCLKQLKKKNPDKKFLIILDNCRIHHAKKVNSWLKHWKAGKNIVRFIFLPAYAPEINPVERFNNVVKGALKKDECLSSQSVKKNAKEFVAEFLADAKKDNKKVKNLFYDEDCRYSIDIFEKVANEE